MRMRLPLFSGFLVKEILPANPRTWRLNKEHNKLRCNRGAEATFCADAFNLHKKKRDAK
jgi:hypothetical protein